MTNITYQFNIGVDIAKQKIDVSFNDQRVASFENSLALPQGEGIFFLNLMAMWPEIGWFIAPKNGYRHNGVANRIWIQAADCVRHNQINDWKVGT